MKKIFKYLSATILSLVVTAFMVFAATEEEIIDDVIAGQKKAQYNINLNAPFTKDTCGINEVVNPETGSITYSVPLFSLNARTFEETLKLSFNLYNAKLKQESLGYNSTSSSYLSTSSDFTKFEVTNECFAVGWKLDLPYVEKNRKNIYVHMPDGSVYLHDSLEYTGLSDYELFDVIFSTSNSTYTLSYLDGTVYSFDSNGLLNKISDRHGNYIDYIWNKTVEPYYLSEIVSCTGEKIVVSGTKNAVSISLNDRSYLIHRENLVPDASPFLVSITDPAGRKSSFEYNKHTLDFKLNQNSNIGSLDYYAISNIVFENGAKTVYSYQTSKKNSSTGYISYLKLSKRYDIAPDGEKSNIQSYIYTGEPDGYPLYTDGALPDDYTYSTTIFNQDGSKEIIKYSGTHEQIAKYVYVNDLVLSEEFFVYDIRRMPSKTVKVIYSDDMESRFVYTDTKYNRKGQLLSYDTYNDFYGSNKLKIEYQYSELYGINTYQKQNIDDNNFIEIKSSLSDNGKNITCLSTCLNGNVIKSIYYNYDSYGNVISVKEQIDNSSYKEENYVFSSNTAYTYPDKYILRNVKNADGQSLDIVVAYEYDSFGNILSSTDGCANKTSYKYDKLNNVISETLPSGSVRNNKYNFKDNIIVTTDALGNTITYYYDAFGRLVKVEDKNKNLLTEKTYNSLGLIESETDAIGTRFTYEYDSFNRVSKITTVGKNDALLTQTNYSYDEVYYMGGPAYSRFETSVVSSAGEIKTAYLFDFLGRQMVVENYGENQTRVTQYEYDYLGNNIKIVYPDLSVQENEYDVFGNVISSTYGGITQKYTYDLLGNNTSVTNGEGETNYMFYNALGLEIITKTPYTDNNSFCFSKTYYDACGRAVKQLDAENNEVNFAYDANGNVVKVVEGESVTTYEYDAENRMIAMHTGSENKKLTQRYEYDHFGNVVKTCDELGYTETYSYDLNGNVLTYVDKNGTVIYNTYDGLNRIIKTRNSVDETEFNYSYDKAGLLLSVNDTSYKYNRFGELIKQTQNGISQNFSYNSLGNRQTYSLTNGEKAEMYLSYTYDSAGRLSGVSSPLGKQIYTYDKANRLISSNNAVSRIGSVYTYYPSGNIKTLSQIHGLEATDFVSYEYDKNGFRTVENGPDIEKRYVYDSQNRLSQSFDQKRNLLSVYNYDEFGNISKIENFVNGHSNETLYSYDKNNRLVSRNIDGTTTNYTYDRQGNLVYDGTSVYRYNGFNRLVGINSDHSNISYTYDHTGLRTGKTVNGVYTKLINDGQDVVAQYVDGNGSYFYRGINLIGYTNSYNDVNFYRFNAHGDVTSVVDCFGNVVRNYEYDAFGKQRVNPKIVINSRRDDNPFRYCGEYFDSETNLIYLRARYYNPDLQRFLSEDPVKDGVNWYVYCGNNPIKYCDSNGQFVQVVEWFLYSPVVQQGLQYLSNSASYAWTNISSFVAQNWHIVQQAAYETSLYGPAIIDGINSWIHSGYGNQVEQAVSEASSKNNKASNNNGKNSSSNNTSNSSNSHNPKDPKNWNKDSVKVNSKELYNNKNVRIDVENPNPGQRPGQVHLQISEGANKGKYIFDNVSRQFYDTSTGEVASKNIQKYLENPDILSAIDKGLTKYLGVSGIK